MIQDERNHSLSMEVIENFIYNVLPLLDELENGPIHGDFNEQNILGKLSKKNLVNAVKLCKFISLFFIILQWKRITKNQKNISFLACWILEMFIPAIIFLI